MAMEAIKDHKWAYLMAGGGSAYLVARAIKGSKIVGFEDLGMEAIYEFEVQDMPVTVAVDSEGQSVHHLAPLVWQEKIKREKLLEGVRSEEHTSELQSLMRISYAVFCLKKKTKQQKETT